MPEFKDPRLQIEQGFISYTDSTISGSLILTTGSIVFPDLTSQSTAAVEGGSGTPGGSSGQIQYNNNNNFGGVPNLTWNGTTLSATGSFSGSLVGTGSWAVSSSRAITSSFALTSSFVNTLTQSVDITGSVTANIFLSTDNGNGTNFKVGDDTWIGDINVADTLQVRGQQNGGKGYIKFGTGSSNPIIGSSGTSVLEIQNGYIQMPSRPAFRVTGSSSNNITATTTLTSTQVGVDYNQGNYYTASSGVFTAPTSGLYNVYMNIRVGNNATSNQAILYKNDTTPMLMWETSTNTGATHFGVSGVIYLASNDNLRVKVTVGTIQFDGNDSWGATYIG